jgi:methylaspartate ammonia-lyase
MKVARALAVPARGGYFNEDLDAIGRGAPRDGFVYTGSPVSDGFSRIQMPSEAVSIVLVLDSGVAVSGDAMSVEYSAAGGRRGRFESAEQLPLIQEVGAFLEGQEITSFLAMCDALERQEFDRRMHRPAALYGFSQALLNAVAVSRGTTGAEVLATELQNQLATAPIPVYVQTGDERYTNVDKAILKRADVFPHGLINDVDTKLGRRGELLADYVEWVVGRIRRFGDSDYHPELHLDVYGLLGTIFEHDAERIADYLADLERTAAPYTLCIETPVLMDERDAQIAALAGVRRALEARESTVQLIVDEWANDLDDIRAFLDAGATHMLNVKSPDVGSVARSAEAILECWASGVRPILGGSCTDTDVSARVMAHVALATSPAWVLARPGMGVDEGLQIVANEMARTLALIDARTAAAHRGAP